MTCLECGNCRNEDHVFFCPARNEFVIREEIAHARLVKEKTSQWKKGDPSYEYHRRRVRKERDDLKIG